MLNDINDIYYIKYALQLCDMQTIELVDTFNALVGSRVWTGQRAYHDRALIDEFRRRGIDVTAVANGQAISFARRVSYDPTANSLVAEG